MKRKAYLAFVVGFFLITIFVWTIPSSHEICDQKSESKIKNCSNYRIPPYLFFKTVNFSNDYAGAITALATVAIGLFTLLLKQSTDRLWIADKEKTEATERAFIFIEGFNYELTTALDGLVGTEHMPAIYRTPQTRGLFITRFAFQPRWKNSGSTPTRNMVIRINWGGTVFPTAPSYTYSDQERPFFVGPRATEGSDFVEMSAAPQILIDWSFNPVPPQPILLIWGRADYEDVFGNSHFVEWCYRLRPERHATERMAANFIQWGDYNRTD